MKKYTGLRDDEVARSREIHGANRLAKRKRISFLHRLFSNFSDPIIKVLLAALFINTIFTLKNMNISECLGIVAAIVISTLVSTISEHGSENAFERLLEESDRPVVRVIRSGAMAEIPPEDLVVDDIVLLGSGERIPADGILLEGNLSVDQSALNGESKEARKRTSARTLPCEPASENRVFCGSIVTHGTGVFQVSAVGEKTLLGGVAADLQIDTRESPLKLRLSHLAKVISRIGYILAIVVAFSYLFGKVLWSNQFDPVRIMAAYPDVRSVASLLIRALTLAITIVVVAVPEGLPMMICVVLSSNMKSMLKDSILVKKLVGIETAGSLNLLFCDKTGTITDGIQSVEGIVFSDGGFVTNRKKIEANRVYPLLKQSAMYNTDCTVIQKKAVGSNATDRAVTDFFGSEVADDVLQKIPFDSRYKYSAAKTPDGRIFVKGAPDVLLRGIRKTVGPNGNTIDFLPDKVMETARRLTDQSFRLIAVIMTDRMPSAMGFGEAVFVGLIAIRDRIRESAAPSVHTLRKAGIRVVMVTGDGKETAQAIAREAGIVRSPDDRVITGGELSHMSDEEVTAILPSLAVVSRALPGDKTRLVRLAQNSGLVVGMTGDGINDAPALKLSDVGFAMGSGTDIAKEAGDIVILNNDISAIVKAVLYGRTIFKSIRKFIVFQLTMNLCAVSVTLIGPFLGIETPITIIQMLWINIIMDTLGGLAFAGEAPTADTMEEPPKQREEPLLNRSMMGKILWNGCTTVVLSVIFMLDSAVKRNLGFDRDPLLFYSAFFTLFIFLGIMNFFNARSDRINLLAGLGKNRSFLSITLLITVVQLLMVYFGGDIFRTTALSARTVLALAMLSFVILPMDTIRRVLFRPLKRHNVKGSVGGEYAVGCGAKE